MIAWGYNYYGQCNVPALPAGLAWAEIRAGGHHSLARRSDGVVVAWGYNFFGQCNVPALPTGHTWVEIAGGGYHSIARRSDGALIAWGDNSYGQCNVPVLAAGLSYLAGAGGYWGTVARTGPESSYTTTGSGCAGSMPASRLVPDDTPRIAATLRVTIDRLPVNAAFRITGFSSTNSTLGPLPLALGPFGMPACTLHTSIDSVDLLVGTGGMATFPLAIPDLPSLVGARFFHQALVLDPAAGNALGAVASEAATAVVGR